MINIKLFIIHQLKFIYGVVVCFVNKFPLKILYLCDVDLTQIPKTTTFSHPIGIVIRGNTKIGENCTFRQGVTVGQRMNENEGATIGDNVDFGAGAIVLGNVVIGSNAYIGAGSIVLKDVPTGYVITGVWK